MRAGNVPKGASRYNVFTEQFLKSFANRSGFFRTCYILEITADFEIIRSNFFITRQVTNNEL